MPGLVNPGLLTCRADKEPGKEKRQGGVIVPEGDKAAQQIRAPQKRAVCRGGSTDDDVVAAAGTGVAAVQHELFGAETALPGTVIEGGRGIHHLPPAVHWLDVDFDDAGVRRDLQALQPLI